MTEKLLDYFETLENHFDYYHTIDDNIIKEIVIKAQEKGIHLYGYEAFDPLSLFECVCSDFGYRSLFDKDGNLVKNIINKEILYEILFSYGYYYNNDLKIALQKVQTVPFEQKTKLAHSLIFNGKNGYKNVKNFEFDGHYIYLTDQSDYTYTIIDLKNYDMSKDEFNISRISRIISNGGQNDCHNYASQMVTLLPEGETITAACPRFMGDTYYLHSYTEYGDYIIDLTLNLMMTKDDYYRLMSPLELSRTKNTDIPFKKKEIESKIGSLESIGKRDWSYILYIAFMNIKDNPELLNNFTQDNISRKKI